MSKTLRQFQCRDDLWTRVDALAKRRGISTDDVVQAALLQLFKSKKKEGESSVVAPAPTAAAPAGIGRTVAPTPPGPVARPTAPAGLPRPPGPPTPVRPISAGPPPGGAATVSPGLGGTLKPTMPAGPRLPRPGSQPVTAAPSMSPTPVASSAVPSPPKSATPSLPRPQTIPPGRLPPPAGKPSPSQVRPLYLMFESQWYEVDKEEYVIGRGQKFSDLPIKDANISRRHCSIVRRGPDYFIKDLGSTNGVEFEGTRVDNHKINEGSVYFLCDHELRFSFTPPSSMG